MGTDYGVVAGGSIQRAGDLSPCPVDFAQIWKLIETVEKETRFTAGTYNVSVLSAIRRSNQCYEETFTTGE